MTVYRHVLLVVALLVLGCAKENPGESPPRDTFHFPISVLADEEASPGKPILYVVSSNFDLKYNRGTVIAVDTGALTTMDGAVGSIIDPAKNSVLIDSFAGRIASYVPKNRQSSTEKRLFIPTRSSGFLNAIRADGATLSCRNPPQGDPKDCLSEGIKLEQPGRNIVRAVDPFGVAIDGQNVFVTHIKMADDPVDSDKNLTSYLVQIDAESLQDPAFHNIGMAPADGIAVVPNVGVFFTGRSVVMGSLPDTYNSSKALRSLIGGSIVDNNLTNSTHILDASGIGVSSDKSRLYLATRSPDGLLVMDIGIDPGTGLPRNRVVGFTVLPTGPSEVMVIDRSKLNMRDLVAISCKDSDSVAFFDDELGKVSATIEGVSSPYGKLSNPYGMAQSSLVSQSQGRRIFVASFLDHSVGVIDIADIAQPHTAQFVGFLRGGK